MQIVHIHALTVQTYTAFINDVQYCKFYKPKKKKQMLFADRLFNEKEKYKAICDDLDQTFAELTGY